MRRITSQPVRHEEDPKTPERWRHLAIATRTTSTPRKIIPDIFTVKTLFNNPQYNVNSVGGDAISVFLKVEAFGEKYILPKVGVRICGRNSQIPTKSYDFGMSRKFNVQYTLRHGLYRSESSLLHFISHNVWSSFFKGIKNYHVFEYENGGGVKRQ